MEVRYAIGLWLFGSIRDRFAIYHPERDLRGKFEEASKVKGAEGLEVIYPAEFGDEQLDEFKSLLKEYKLKVAGLLVDLFTGPKWINGSLTARDEKLRKEAIALAQRAMDVAEEVECKTVSLWLGQDGYDYVFQTDYKRAWDWLVEGVREIASRRSDVRLALEYKIKEPRARIFVGTVGKALLIAEEVGLKNVGLTIDFGHALYSFENPAESVVLAHRLGRLFHLHFNDNYRDWDHDLITGSVNFWDLLEVFYWLKKINYRGWISMDIYPYREDVVKACERSIGNLKLAEKLVEKIGIENLDECIRVGDATKTAETLWNLFL
ncbi:MAG TPA: xylose isomerase [Nitrososphaeria archaeon]|nr:MAG: xylose isomerase [Thermoprotei archaeon]RLG09471.1 MAG: xylose isomerase [Nitrososphaerota archaeon]RLI46756.1 MAG: xylose isomerase [Candidatus Bathyarchaeota archaeon]HDJ67006.1 xylose isomerase [Nitrososphaeria archaeon]